MKFFLFNKKKKEPEICNVTLEEELTNIVKDTKSSKIDYIIDLVKGLCIIEARKGNSSITVDIIDIVPDGNINTFYDLAENFYIKTGILWQYKADELKFNKVIFHWGESKLNLLKINGYYYKKKDILLESLKNNGESFNGRTTDFGSVYLGSSPSSPANKV